MLRSRIDRAGSPAPEPGRRRRPKSLAALAAGTTASLLLGAGLALGGAARPTRPSPTPPARPPPAAASRWPTSTSGRSTRTRTTPRRSRTPAWPGSWTT
ncbi:hypothetical protein ACFQ0M_16755 [Kitasatospora aburaviensis]